MSGQHCKNYGVIGKQFTVTRENNVDRCCTWSLESQRGFQILLLFCYITNNLVIGPLGNSEFCYPRISVYSIIINRCVDVFYIILCFCSCIRHSSETILRQDFGWWSTSTDLCVSWGKKCPSGGDKYSHLLPHTGKCKLNSSFSLLRVAEGENSTLKALVSKQCHITYMYCTVSFV